MFKNSEGEFSDYVRAIREFRSGWACGAWRKKDYIWRKNT